MSDSVQPHRWQPTRLPCPWDSPGKNTGVGCHFLLQCIRVKSESEVAQSCLTSLPHGLQPTRLLHPWDFPVMPNSVQPHRWQPTRLLRPWDSPGKNTGVGCHLLLQCMKVKSESEVAQSCPTLSVVYLYRFSNSICSLCVSVSHLVILAIFHAFSLLYLL